uniref:Uncharacterized protein n=1 Tax=Avena sativa TaxID=4498 RepID=A0ACD5XHK7_AVESA
MDLATGAMGSLLLKLGELLKEEYELQTGAKEDVQYLERELRSMHIALRKVGDVPRDQLDEQVKLWVDDVRDLSYKMEDIVDTFLVRVEGSDPTVKPQSLKRLMKMMGELFTRAKTRHEIAGKIKDIKIRVQEVADRRDKYKVTDMVVNPAGATMVDPRLLALYKDHKELVGIDGALNKLTEMLSDGGGDVFKQLKTLSILGFGGLGKTTLAKAVYDELQAQFDCSVFVPVGRNPSVKKLLNDIIYGINKQMYSGLDERQLIDELQGLLKNKRYFIVIDDIWDTEIWEIIMCAFRHNNCASRIITTTRILEVATHTGEVYRLEPLSQDLSEELFNTRLFGGKRKGSYDELSEAYGKILRKCGGVPLAITTIASLLVGKPVEFWSKVYNSIGFGNEDSKDVDNTRKIILYSYYDLPCHLRTCLLYMSIYPEDHIIEKDSLIWKWVAEGFVHEEPDIGLYEIGERYFNELVNKSMIQPVERPPKDKDGIIIGCRIHDMVLDMIRMLAKEENFVTILDSNEQCTYSVRSNVRRLAIGDKNRLADMCLTQVRSFNALSGEVILPSLSLFQLLRVLALQGGTFPEHNTNKYLKTIGKLAHLRYLGLGNMVDIPELPAEIGYLRFLQTLDLGCEGLQELPQSVGQLSQLKCLRAYGMNLIMPDWIGNLTSLEELWVSQVHESSNFIDELGKLKELRKLRFAGSLWLLGASSTKAWAESLVKLQKIQVIDISLVMSVGYDGSTCSWEGYVRPRHVCVLHLSYRHPGLLAPITLSLLENLPRLSRLLKSEIFARFPELINLRLNMPRGEHHDIMGAQGAFSKLRVFKSATPGHSLEGERMPSLESLDFRIQLRDSSDGKDGDFDFGSLGNLPLLQNETVNFWYGS